jgi:hypothetical protein
VLFLLPTVALWFFLSAILLLRVVVVQVERFPFFALLLFVDGFGDRTVLDASRVPSPRL